MQTASASASGYYFDKRDNVNHSNQYTFLHTYWCTGADFMRPEGLEPPIFESWGSCNISAPSIFDKRDNVNTHKLAALQQRRRISNIQFLLNAMKLPPHI